MSTFVITACIFVRKYLLKAIIDKIKFSLSPPPPSLLRARRRKIFRIKKSNKLPLVDQHIAAGDREIHDGTEPGYRKTNADIILSTPPVPPVYRAVASDFSARIARVWEDDNAPVASRPIRLTYGYALRGEFCCTRRQSFDNGSRNYSH